MKPFQQMLIFIALVAVLVSFSVNAADASGDSDAESGDLGNCSVSAPTCQSGQHSLLVSRTCHGKKNAGSEYACLPESEIRSRYEAKDRFFRADLKKLDALLKQPVGELDAKSVVKRRQAIKSTLNRLKYLTGFELKKFDTVDDLRKKRHRKLAELEQRQSHLEAYSKQLEGRRLFLIASGRLSQVMDDVHAKAKSVHVSMVRAVEAVQDGARHVRRTVKAQHECFQREESRRKALNDAAIKSIMEAVDEEQISPAEMAALFIYNHDIDSQTKERVAKTLSAEHPRFWSSLKLNLDGYNVAIELYGSIAKGASDIAKASGNLRREAVLITKFLDTNLTAIERDLGKGSEVYRRTKALQDKIFSVIENEFSVVTTTPATLAARYEKLKTLWTEYRDVEHVRSDAKFKQIQRLENTVKVLEFVRDASKLTVTVGVGIVSGGLASGAVGAGFGALDQISQQAILEEKVDWGKVARHTAIDGAVAGLTGGSAGMVRGVAAQAANRAALYGGTEVVANVVAKGTAVVAGHEVDSLVGAGGQMLKVGVDAKVHGQSVSFEDLSEIGLDAYRANHSWQALVTSAGAMGIRAGLQPHAPGAITRAPSAIQPKDGKKLVVSSAHAGGNPKQNIAALEKHGLLPQESVQVQGAKYSLSAPFDMGGGRVGVIAVVEVNGHRSTQAFYRSNSQGTFRLLPARNKGLGAMGIPGYDKAGGEHQLELPAGLQRHLQQKLTQSKVISGIPEDVFEGAVRVNRSVDDYLKYHESPDGVAKQVQSESILAPPGATTLSARRDMRAPEDVRISNQERRPDFASGPVMTYKTATATAGDVDAMVYRSRDGKVEYTIFKDQGGRIWFANGTAADAPIVRGAGVPSRAIDGGELMTPLWEYGQQIPNGFRGEANATNSQYYDSWQYLKKIPEIQEWYRANGEAVPP